LADNCECLFGQHRDGGLDMNVIDVYQRWGITGRDTVVSILDDGIEKDHPDLVKNYVRCTSLMLDFLWFTYYVLHFHLFRYICNTLICVKSLICSFIYFWHTPLGMHSICLQSGQFWATSFASFRERLLDSRSCWNSLHPSTRASWWSPPVLQEEAVKILSSVSSGIRAKWPNREKCHAWTILKGVVAQLSIPCHHSALINSINPEYISLGNCPVLRAIQEDG